MNKYVRISEHWKRVWVKSPISGHEWPEDIKRLGYFVHTPYGKTFYKTLKAAQQEYDECTEFFNKFPIQEY